MMFWRYESFLFFMHDAAPVLLGAGGDFDGVIINAVCVAAIRAADFLQKSEILQSMSIDEDVVRAFHIRKPVQRKTDAMINFHANIQKKRGDEHSPYERKGYEVSQETIGVKSVIHNKR